MKKVLLLSAVLVFVTVILLPSLIIRGLGPFWPRPAKTNMAQKGEDILIRVYMPQSGKIVELPLEEYIKGVVAAEMPAEFELEALKAQAVAARTYAVKNMVIFGGAGLDGHPGADVSTDHKTSQAWSSEAEMIAKWGPAAYQRYWKKISQAVEETGGLIITYGGEPIHAVFHSTSGERTASAREVWNYDYPYLQSVVCNWDKASPRYAETKAIALQEVENRLGPEAGIMLAAKNGTSGVAQIIDRTESGRVAQARIGSKTYTGLELREKLELRSSNFTLEVRDDKMVVKSTGYGHGVGLCQYGANGAAKEGKSFRDILTYYYTGVVIKNIHSS